MCLLHGRPDRTNEMKESMEHRIKSLLWLDEVHNFCVRASFEEVVVVCALVALVKTVLVVEACRGASGACAATRDPVRTIVELVVAAFCLYGRCAWPTVQRCPSCQRGSRR